VPVDVYEDQSSRLNFIEDICRGGAIYDLVQSAIRTPTLDRPPAGWHVLDVMPKKSRRQRDWVALMIDVHPDEVIQTLFCPAK